MAHAGEAAVKLMLPQPPRQLQVDEGKRQTSGNTVLVQSSCLTRVHVTHNYLSDNYTYRTCSYLSERSESMCPSWKVLGDHCILGKVPSRTFGASCVGSTSIGISRWDACSTVYYRNYKYTVWTFKDLSIHFLTLC